MCYAYQRNLIYVLIYGRKKKTLFVAALDYYLCECCFFLFFVWLNRLSFELSIINVTTYVQLFIRNSIIIIANHITIRFRLCNVLRFNQCRLFSNALRNRSQWQLNVSKPYDKRIFSPIIFEAMLWLSVFLNSKY